MAISLTTEMKLGFPCLALGCILFLVSFGAPYWFVTNSFDDTTVHYGLWLACAEGECSTFYNTPPWLVGVDALECVALVLLLVAVVTILVLAFKKHKSLSLLCCIACIGSGLFGAIGAAVYCAMEAITGIYVTWAFYINVVGDVIIGLAGVCMLVNTIHGWIRQPQYDSSGIQNPLAL